MSQAGVSANRLELLQIADAVAREKSIDRQVVMTAMEDAIQKAAKSRYGTENDIRCKIDAKTGEELWLVRTYDIDRALYITGAPKAFNGKVLIGNGGTENGPNRGYVTAYDAETGEQAWRFWIVPGNPADGFEDAAMEMAADTWTGEWWKFGGGGNAWHGFTYDAELDLLYIGTGNGAPWNRKVRSPGGGDNLFLCSIVALDPDTGEYRWHYQTTPGETWDYNSNMDIILADLEIEPLDQHATLGRPVGLERLNEFLEGHFFSLPV